MFRTLLILLITLSVLLVACSPIARPEQTGIAQQIVLGKGNSVGQTFVAKYDGLMGVEITVSHTARITLSYHLRTSGDQTDLAGGEITLEPNIAPAFVPLSFAPQPDSHQASYYFLVETNSLDSLAVWAAPGATYLNGAAYENDAPLPDSQLAFRLVYHPGWLVWGLLKEFVTWLGWLIVSGFLFALPGWGLFAAVWPGWDDKDKFALVWAEKLALSVGLGLAIYPIFFAWVGWAGLPVGETLAWLIPLTALVFLIWKYRRIGIQNGLRSFSSEATSLQSMLLIFILGILILTRFWAIRNLDVGLWGDAYHHTLITQLIVDHGGLFNSWEPYTELKSFTYHFGFHTGAALLHWITKLSIAQSVLVFGQLINVFAVLVIFPLAIQIAGTAHKTTASWAGLVGVVLAGLWISIPGFYVNWGRYTQLTGQVILPVAIWLLWEMLDSKSVSWRHKWVTGVVLCGLALTHYRVVAFAATFLAAYGSVRVWKGKILPVTGHVIGVGLIAGLLFSPWLFHLFAGKLVDFLTAVLKASPAETSQAVRQYNQIGDIGQYLPISVWGAMLVGLLGGILKKNSKVIVVGAWGLFTLLVANPGWMGLPGAGAINNFSVFIAAYIPAGLLIGAGFAWIFETIEKARFSRAIFASALIGAAIWGGRMRVADVHPSVHSLATRPDLQAGGWIQENLPPDSLFLVNSFGAFEGSSVVGSDGGWWLPILAQRKITLPPILYVSETGPRPEYIPWVNELTFQIEQYGIEHPDVLASLLERGVTHVYIGQLQGRANYSGSVIEPGVLLASPHFRQVYHQDRVWVFEFLP